MLDFSYQEAAAATDPILTHCSSQSGIVVSVLDGTERRRLKPPTLGLPHRGIVKVKKGRRYH